MFFTYIISFLLMFAIYWTFSISRIIFSEEFIVTVIPEKWNPHPNYRNKTFSIFKFRFHKIYDWSDFWPKSIINSGLNKFLWSIIKGLSLRWHPRNIFCIVSTCFVKWLRKGITVVNVGLCLKLRYRHPCCCFKCCSYWKWVT